MAKAEKFTLRKLLDAKRDLPKVALVCIILIAIASTILIYSTRLSFAGTVLLGLAGWFFLWHLQSAYGTDRIWGAAGLMLIVVIIATPAVIGVAFFMEDPVADWRHLLFSVMLSSTFFAVALCLYWIRTHGELGDRERELGQRTDFLASVGLVNAATAKTDPGEHRRRTQELTSDLISKETTFLRIQVINGLDDFVDECSPIRAKLLALQSDGAGPWSHWTTEEEQGIRVLILDPFCAFAQQRALNLANDGMSEHAARQKYVRDFLASQNFLERLGVPYRIYCSRPMFRLYMGTQSSSERWCIQQTYLKDRHGFETPTFEYQLSRGNTRYEDCFISVASQSFEYLWERGFKSHSVQDLQDAAHVTYLAKMYGLTTCDGEANALDLSRLRQEVSEYAGRAFSSAEVLMN